MSSELTEISTDSQQGVKSMNEQIKIAGVASPRQGARDGVRTELSVFLKVKPGHEKQIRAIFSDPSSDLERARAAMVDVGTLHDARQVLFDNDTRLLIATSFDGDWDVYIEDFARTLVLKSWDTFLIHCEDYPDPGAPSLSLDQTKEFLTAH